MKMRAVPDDFDNVQALHSPYGAVHPNQGHPMHSLSTPLQSPVDFMPGYSLANPHSSHDLSHQSHGSHMMRPLMVDTMRRPHDEHISPTGLSPAFGQFGTMATPGGADVLSPLSLSTDGGRYYGHGGNGSHLSSPMSAGPRSADAFGRQNSYQSLSHSRQQVRPLQPLQLRETMNRSRSESLQSPLRTSMSWKGDTLDYGSYQTSSSGGGQQSPQLSGRQQSVYQPQNQGEIGGNAGNASGGGGGGGGQYDGSTYSGSSHNFHVLLARCFLGGVSAPFLDLFFFETRFGCRTSDESARICRSHVIWSLPLTWVRVHILLVLVLTFVLQGRACRRVPRT